MVGSVFGIKYALTAKPGIINEIVLGVANPRGSEYFGFIARAHLLRRSVLASAGLNHHAILTGNAFRHNLVGIAETIAKMFIVACCPEDVPISTFRPAHGVVFEQRCEQFGGMLADIVFANVD